MSLTHLDPCLWANGTFSIANVLERCQSYTKIYENGASYIVLHIFAQNSISRYFWLRPKDPQFVSTTFIGKQFSRFTQQRTTHAELFRRHEARTDNDKIEMTSLPGPFTLVQILLFGLRTKIYSKLNNDQGCAWTIKSSVVITPRYIAYAASCTLSNFVISDELASGHQVILLGDWTVWRRETIRKMRFICFLAFKSYLIATIHISHIISVKELQMVEITLLSAASIEWDRQRPLERDRIPIKTIVFPKQFCTMRKRRNLRPQ